MAMLASKPPVRTGKCSLILVIDGRRYRVTPGEPTCRGAKIWRLRVCAGQVRAGQLYSVCSVHKHVDCTCPDSTLNFAVCKHIRALQALGLVAKTATPSTMIAWRNTQPSRRRKPPVPSLAGPVPVAAAAQPVKAATRRRHVPDLPVNDAHTFAVGWNDAVRSHISALIGAKGGAQ